MEQFISIQARSMASAPGPAALGRLLGGGNESAKLSARRAVNHSHAWRWH